MIRATALALTLVMGLVSCPSRAGQIAPTTTSTLPATSTTVPPTTSSTSPPTATTTTFGTTTTLTGCGEGLGPVPQGAMGPTTVIGDVDGDGLDDRITGYLLGSDDPLTATAAVLHLELASGHTTAIDLHSLTLAPGPTLSRPERIVAMGGEHLVVTAIAGILPGILYGFFALDGCSLALVRTDAGEVPEIRAGGGASHDDWFSCDRDSVTMLRFGYDDPASGIYDMGEVVGGFRYHDMRFSPTAPAAPDVDLPAARDAVRLAYPTCVH